MDNGFTFFKNFLNSASCSVLYRGGKRWLTFPPEHDGMTVTNIGGVSGEPAKNGGAARVTRVKMPDTIESISSRAFLHCPSLKKIAVPKSVKKIGDGAFPNGIEEICFGDCAGWTVSYDGKTESVPEEEISDPRKAAGFYRVHLMWEWVKD